MKKEVVKKTLRLTSEDAELLGQKAQMMNLNENEYLRLLIRDKPAEIPEIRNLLKKLINEINHIGVNVNQIAKSSNAGYFSSSDRQELSAYMQKLNEGIRKLVEKLGYQ